MKTVYVIGAGASREVGLPTGEELKVKISKLLNIKLDRFRKYRASGDEKIFDAIRLHAIKTNGNDGNLSFFTNEAMRISNALPLAISIDNFIDMHKNNEKVALCGKLAIIRSILEAEKSSKLYFDRYKASGAINFKDLTETWYIPFFRTLTENCTKEDLSKRFENITLIIFNYDRCVEHFLYNALQCCYDITKPEAAKIIKSINIFHPYGSVGTLPWLHEDENIEFGDELSAEKLLRLAQKIKTFTEGTNPASSEIVEIKKHMAQTKRLVFLGFAFHELNMELIKPKQGIERQSLVNIECPRNCASCYATAYGFSNSDKLVISKMISDLYPRTYNPITPELSNSTCGGFFIDYSKNLSFSKL